MKKAVFTLILALCLAILTPFASFAQTDAIQIGVLQLVEHPALDAAYKGFVDGLAEAGFVDGENIEIDFRNAQADQSNLMTMSDRFVKNNVDLILAIATPATQSVASATSTIPILFTAVTDPVAARLVESWEKPGLNVTGVSDIGPIEDQINLCRRLLPEAKTIGIIYNSSEVNSEVQAKEAEKYANEAGFKVEFGTVTSVNDIEQVATSLAAKSDIFYVPTDNTIASAIPNLVQVAQEKGLLIVGGEEGQVESGAAATISISYYKLGLQTAAMAVRILKDGATPADLPVEKLEDTDLIINQAYADEIGYTYPKEIIDAANTVY